MGEGSDHKHGFRVCAKRWIAGIMVIAWCFPLALGEGGGGVGMGRSLLSFRETQGNVSFHCSPSGPCLPCQYSEKNDEKYRCSETGYRIPLKCVEIQDGSKEETSKKNQRRLFSFANNARSKFSADQKANTVKWRRLLDASSASKGGEQSYITYRSCLPAETEEKLSVFGFEVIMVCLLLVSGPIVYIRQKRTITMAGVGAVRIPTNSPRL